MGFTTSISGNHSIRFKTDFIWITPSGIPRYLIKESDLIRVNLRTGKAVGRHKPSIELEMHKKIYDKRHDVKAIVHTHSPFTLGIAISHKFQQVIEEAKLIVGTPAVITNQPSGSIELSEAVSNAFFSSTRVVVIKNHGVVAVGRNLHSARAVIESLEEWAKILTVSKIFGGPKTTLENK